MGKNLFSLNKKNKSPENSFKSLSESSSSECAADSSPSPSIAIRIQDSNDLRNVFDRYDTNGDGKISYSELESMLKCLGNSGSKEEVESMMRAADLDGDGYISLEEFITVNKMETDSAKCVEDLRNAFTVFDRDQNGLISPEELHHVLSGMGEKTSLTDCKAMINGADSNGDGAVNFDEFMRMMTRSQN